MNRLKYTDIKNHLERKEFTILTGARQVGKSTMLRQIADELSQSGTPTAFLNLERKNILSDLDENPENVFKYVNSVQGQRAFIFVDEVQYLSDPTNFLKLLYDEYADKIKIVATGSSAFYIDRKFKDSLAGRKKIFELHTFSFDEFLHFKGREDLRNDLAGLKNNPGFISIHTDLLEVLFEEYLTYGGYPAVVLENSIQGKIDKLEEIKYSYIKRDVSDSGVTDDTKFYKLMMLLAGQAGNLLNVNELSNTLQIAHATVENYLYIMQKCFHITLVKPFSNNLRKELMKMPKIYFHDTGLRNSLLNNFNPLNVRPDKGVIVEEYIFHRLMEIHDKYTIKFWRTTDGNEVDFVVETAPDKGLAYEVKYADTDIKLSKYKKFVEHYPNYPLEYKYLASRKSKNMLLRF